MAEGLSVAQARPRVLPKISFGPGLFAAVPWLMLASAMRFVAYTNPAVALPAYILADLAIFLAFLLAAQRMIELADGTTRLGRLDFNEQMRLACKVLGRVVLLLIAAAIVIAVVGPRELAMTMLIGFDGIAFDQGSKVGIIWSAFLAALVLLMVVRAGEGGDVAFFAASKELAQRSLYLVPAIVVLTGILIAMSAVQGEVRGLVWYFFQTGAPQPIKNLVYFFFVFGFATVRLWVTLAVLVFALRESYRGTPA
jgi:hypothetical protein